MRQAARVTVIGECECPRSTETQQTCGQAWTRNRSRRHARVRAFKSLQDGESNELHKVQRLAQGRVLMVDSTCPPWSSNAKFITRQLPHVLLALLWGSRPKISQSIQRVDPSTRFCWPTASPGIVARAPCAKSTDVSNPQNHSSDNLPGRSPGFRTFHYPPIR